MGAAATTLGFCALALRPRGTGVQTYIGELLAGLSAGTDAALVAAVQADAVGSLPSGVTPLRRATSAGARRAVSGLRSLGSVDLVHGLDVDLPWRGGPMVSTVHDLSVFDVPWAHPGLRAIGERLITRQALRRADAIIAVSSFTAERVEARFGRTPTVVLEAAPSLPEAGGPAEVASLRERYRLPEQFVLHVGTVEPRKGLDTLAAACRAAEVPLILAGHVPTPSNVPAGATTIGYVPDADLPTLYRAASVVGYPTFYEGFGLPPLEAMACRAPVVASAVASLPEVLGDGARLVPQGDVGRWAAALRELLHDTGTRDELVDAGRRHVGRRTWSDVAEETLAVYRRLGVTV